MRGNLNIRLLTRARHMSLFSSPQSTQRQYSNVANVEREWLAVMLDQPDALSRRLEVRPRHTPYFKQLHKEGHVTWAGPIFTSHGSTEGRRPFQGSVIIVKGEDRESVERLLKSDIYTAASVWDWSKAWIVPFRTVHRETTTGATSPSK